MPAISSLVFEEQDRETARVAMPRPEIQLVIRFGPMAEHGLDAHALGPHQAVKRKIILAGQRAISARLHFGTAEAILGVPSFAVANRIVELEELWGVSATRHFMQQLAAARSRIDAAEIVERTIAARVRAHPRRDSLYLAHAAARRLADARVKAVANQLGVSERHLRRVFRDAVGISPKAFARLERFHRAVRAGRAERHANWASIAVATGYYDQAHLIDEFRSIAGVTPRVLLNELTSRPAQSNRSPVTAA